MSLDGAIAQVSYLVSRSIDMAPIIIFSLSSLILLTFGALSNSALAYALWLANQQITVPFFSFEWSY